MKMKKNYQVIYFILLHFVCFSQPGTWTVKGFAPHFRDVNAVQILPSGRIVTAGGHISNNAITAMNHSTDSATTWGGATDSVNAMMNSLHFPTSTTGYTVGNSGKLLKSVDSGQTWRSLILTGNMATRNYNGVYFTDVN